VTRDPWFSYGSTDDRKISRPRQTAGLWTVSTNPVCAEPDRKPADPRNRRLRHPQFGSQRPRRPVRGIPGVLSSVAVITASTCSSNHRARKAGPWRVEQTLESLSHEPRAPLPGAADVDVELVAIAVLLILGGSWSESIARASGTTRRFSFRQTGFARSRQPRAIHQYPGSDPARKPDHVPIPECGDTRTARCHQNRPRRRGQLTPEPRITRVQRWFIPGGAKGLEPPYRPGEMALNCLLYSVSLRGAWFPGICVGVLREVTVLEIFEHDSADGKDGSPATIGFLLRDFRP